MFRQAFTHRFKLAGPLRLEADIAFHSIMHCREHGCSNKNSCSAFFSLPQLLVNPLHWCPFQYVIFCSGEYQKLCGCSSIVIQVERIQERFCPGGACYGIYVSTWHKSSGSYIDRPFSLAFPTLTCRTTCPVIPLLSRLLKGMSRRS